VESIAGRFAWNEDDGLSKDLGPAKIFKDGSSYIGQYNKRGHRSGRGIYIFSSGMKYEGYWKHNKRHGKGRLIFTNGGYYTGNWVRDKRKG